MKHDFQGVIVKISDSIKKNKYVMIVLLAGVLLLLLPVGGGEKENNTTSAIDEPIIEFSLEDTQAQLENILSQIEGAGEVRVMLSVENGGERVLATDSEVVRTTSGGEETEEVNREESQATVVISQGSGTDGVVTLKYIYPEFTGAVVVAQGAGNATVRLDLTEAVAAVTGLEAAKIKVVKMK